MASRSTLLPLVSAQEPGNIFNFLMSDGDHLIVGCWPGSRPGSSVFNGLHYIVREYPFGAAHLSDCDYGIDFSTVTTPDDRVAVIATKPLTANEQWTEMQRGELLLFHHGRPFKSAEECAGLPAEAKPAD